jgi:hypothetical protein
MSFIRTIHTKNIGHLGDCIYSMIMFNQIKDYIETTNILFYFYCHDEYIHEVIDFNNSDNIIILPLSSMKMNENVYELWIGSSDYKYNWYSSSNQLLHYDIFFTVYYNMFLNVINIPIKIEKFTYKGDDLITRCNLINTRTNNAFANIDLLINNGIPQSRQFEYNLDQWNTFVIELSKKYNIITTKKVSNIKCTRDYNLTVKDIAAISININKFIAIESGVITGLYNKFVVDNPDKIVFTLSNDIRYACSFKNFIWKSNLSELRFLLI